MMDGLIAEGGPDMEGGNIQSFQPWFNEEVETFCSRHPCRLQPSGYANEDRPVLSMLMDMNLLVLFRCLNIDGCGLDVKDPTYNFTVLMWASAKGRLRPVRYLIEWAQVSTEDADTYGYTAFLWAVHRGHYLVAQYLVSVAKVRVDVRGNMFDQSALMLACSIGHLALIKLLCRLLPVDWQNAQGSSALTYAAYTGQVGILQFLIEEEHATLSLAHYVSYDAFYVVCMEGHLDAFAYLSTKVDFSQLSHDYLVSLLMKVSRQGHLCIFQTLLERPEVDFAVVTDPGLDERYMDEDVKECWRRYVTIKRRQVKSSCCVF